MKRHDMHNHPKGTGLVFIKGHVPEEQYVIPELDDFRIPVKSMENIEDFMPYLLQVISMKPRHEIIFHLVLQFKNYEKNQPTVVQDISDGR
jgi:hypothetical protein